ncbi:MAG TPA: hypothetical protein VLT89_05005 [Usitatibacter sp.]|nr:hypothetical protein [Usitatibacter sp.]
MATTKRKAAPRKAARRPVKKQGPRKVATRASISKPRKARAPVRKRAAPKRRLAGVGNEAVMRATGRSWDEWIKVLDRAGAKRMPHKDIALMLSRKFSVPNWWSQMVTVGYEQAHGLRRTHQRASGFAADASKTMAAAVDRLFHAWHDPQMRERWLPGAPVEVKRATHPKSIRIKWTQNGSSVDVGFTAKGPGRSTVQVSHGKLKTEAEVLRQKAFWKDALARLESLFEPVTELK